MLEIEARLSTEESTLYSLQNELLGLRRDLWKNPSSASNVDQRLSAFSNRITGDLKSQANMGLDEWIEKLPFPLASILRAWQATPSDDFKSKHEHLLHFFEATAEFLSIILLSAFSANEGLFALHKEKIADAMEKQNLSFQRATFGTWKLVLEYLGKQTRQLLQTSGKKPEDAKNDRALCATIFADNTLSLPGLLSTKGIVSVMSATNKMRNDWSGHGGVVGNSEAQFRNERLHGQLLKLREEMVDVWVDSLLVQVLHCRPRRGIFENELAVLTGSNNEFLKESRPMPTWLDVESLYIIRRDGGNALKLIPLVQVGPSPQSAKNACYFFNRIEHRGARFISYHFLDNPELTGDFKDAAEAIEALTKV